MVGLNTAMVAAEAPKDVVVPEAAILPQNPNPAPAIPPTNSPNFIVSPGGETIIVPEGATGPRPVDNGKGFQFQGGSGGHGLDPRTSGVRIMDPTEPNQASPGYPNGYASYNNNSQPKKQTVNPYTGRTIAKNDPWWHLPFHR
jgi:hypothetical protein